MANLLWIGDLSLVQTLRRPSECPTNRGIEVCTYVGWKQYSNPGFLWSIYVDIDVVTFFGGEELLNWSGCELN